ncbi:MAG: hypothetical protein QF441_12940 [Bacteriovoracaceae bacterium]|jgi:hypothetical protein|nr:hypothetical protein [Bacteriovoracaceae bacterium]
MIQKKLILVLTFCLVNSVFASEISIDIGQTETVFNRISIPSSQANQLSLPEDESLTSFRLTGFMDTKKGNQIYFLIAPLEVQYQFESDKNFKFNDINFTNNTQTKFNYKFNSYRVGYLWTWKTDSLKYWIGAVAKIRDAKTEVIQGSQTDSFSNIGLVPLLSAGLNLKLYKELYLFTHTDALGSSRGSAYDSQVELKYQIQDYSASLGKRILGGGAENDDVYNFAQFDTSYIKITKYF